MKVIKLCFLQSNLPYFLCQFLVEQIIKKNQLSCSSYKMKRSSSKRKSFNPDVGQDSDEEYQKISIIHTGNFTSNPTSKKQRSQILKKIPIYKILYALGIIAVIATIILHLKQDEQDRTNSIIEIQKSKEIAQEYWKELQLKNLKISTLEDSNAKLENIVREMKSKLDSFQKGVQPQIKKVWNSNENNTHQVVEIVYENDELLQLPIDPLMKTKEGKSIAQFLYSSEELRNKRSDFQKQRRDFIDSKPNFPALYLSKYNVIIDEEAKRLGIDVNEKQYVRMQEKFHFPKDEISICIVIPGYNNNANFRIEYNLNSVFQQNYTNYKIVIINDASTDGSGETYKNYFKFYKIDKKRYTYIENKKRVTALQNFYYASITHCSIDDVVLTLDADDEFIGRNVLKTFNWAYQTHKSGVVYSNFYWFQQPSTLMYGFTSQYSENEKKNNLFRTSPMKFSHLRSFHAYLIHQINPKDLQDENGQFFTITYDLALFYPLMELSCGRVNKIQGQFQYLYNIGTGLNDYNDRGRQVAVDSKIRRQKKYECSQGFEAKMKG